MKKIIFLVIIVLAFNVKLPAQIYSPNLLSYVGQGTIFYPNGFYQGGIYGGYANGVGTFYWRDGSFFSGNFQGGYYNGPGLFVSRLYGYVTGCWSRGIFIGPCNGIYNPYNDNTRVQQEINNVQSSLPNDQRVVSHDPDGYTIRKIDANSQVGQKLLGRGF